MKKIQSLTFLLRGKKISPEILEKIIAKISENGKIINFEHKIFSEKDSAAAEILENNFQKNDDKNEITEIVKHIHDENFLKNFDDLLQNFEKIHSFRDEIIFLREKIPPHFSDPEKILEHFSKIGKTENCILKLKKNFSNAKKLIEKKILLDEIARMKIEIPIDTKYQKLHLSKKIIDSHLNFDVLFENPNLVESSLWSAFSEFKKMHDEIYLQEFSEYQNFVNFMHDSREEIESKIRAHENLEKIPELKTDDENLREIIDSFFAEHEQHDFDLQNVEKNLKINPQYRNFEIGTKIPKKEFEILNKKIEKILQKKLHKIKTKAAKKIAAEKNSEIKKLINLINLSNLDKIVKILNSDDSDEIIETFKKILK